MPAATVYLPINPTIDPSGVLVFGETVTTSDRIINLQTTVSVSSLQAFFKYQEDPTNRDNVFISTMRNNDGGLVADLSGSLTGLSDVDRASYVWWPGIVSTDSNYSNAGGALFHYTNVYEVLLSQIAYVIFGHPLAKAGIANDTDILSHFNSENVARLLVNDLESLNSSNLRVIYQQMVAQDPARFNVQDSTAGANGTNNPLPDSLPFKDGDTIRFEVTLSPYTVSLWGGAVDTIGNGYNVAKNIGLIGTTFPSKTYTLHIGVGSNAVQIIQQGLMCDFQSRNYVTGSGVWYDSSVNSNSCAVGGNIPSTSNGFINFDGNTNYYISYTIPYQTTWTLSIWFNSRDGTVNNCPLVGEPNANGRRNYFIDYDTSSNIRGGFMLEDGNQVNTYGTSVSVPLDTWAYVSVSYDGMNLTTYLNGSNAGTSNVGSQSMGNGGNFTVGGFGWYSFFNGYIGDFNLYNRALSDAEVSSNYNATSNMYQ